MLLPNRHFAISKGEWDIKEDTGKPMKNALYVRTAVCQKARLGPK